MIDILFAIALTLTMLPLGFFFGCSPCCACRVFADDFNRSDSSSLGSTWTEESGNWQIVSNALTIASPSPLARVYAGPSWSPPSTYYHAVSVRLKSSADGDEVGIMFRRGNSEVRDWVILKIGAYATIQTFNRYDSGFGIYVTRASSEEIGVTAPEDTWHELTICEYEYAPLGDDSTEAMVTLGAAVYLNGTLVARAEDYFGGSGFGGSGTGLVAGAIVGIVTGTPEWDWITTDRVNGTTCLCGLCDPTGWTDDFSSETGLWRHPASSPTLWSIEGGRLKNDAGTGSQMRCTKTPPLDGLDVTISVKIYLADTNPPFDVVQVGLGALLIDSPSYPTPSLRIYAYFDVVDAAWYYRVIGYGAGGLAFDVDGLGSPVDGDEIAIRILDVGSGGGTYDVFLSVNGFTIHTQTGMSLTLVQNFASGPWCGGGGWGSSAAYWSNYEVTI